MGHTNGNKFLLNDLPYIGIYSKGPDDNYYTGDSYIFGVSKLLTLINIESIGYRVGDEDYDKLESTFSQREINYAKDFYPTITEANIKKEFIYRYFAQQWNDLNARIIEIKDDQFDKIDRGFYRAIKLKWMVAGDIAKVSSKNLDEINRISKTMPKISSKLNNTIELYNLQRTDII